MRVRPPERQDETRERPGVPSSARQLPVPPARPASLKVRALQWLAQREHSRQELRDKLLYLLRRSARAAGALADARADARAGVGVGVGANLGTDVDADVGTDVGADAGTAPAAHLADHDGDTLGADPAAEVDALLQWLEQHGHLSDARFTESRVNARQARFGNRRIQQELQQHGVRLGTEARQALQQTELARAAELWRRKYGAPAADAAGRVRQMRFLAGRGFSLDVVRRVVQGGAAVADTSGTGPDADPAAG